MTLASFPPTSHLKPGPWSQIPKHSATAPSAPVKLSNSLQASISRSLSVRAEMLHRQFRAGGNSDAEFRLHHQALPGKTDAQAPQRQQVRIGIIYHEPRPAALPPRVRLAVLRRKQHPKSEERTLRGRAVCRILHSHPVLAPLTYIPKMHDMSCEICASRANTMTFRDSYIQAG